MARVYQNGMLSERESDRSLFRTARLRSVIMRDKGSGSGRSSPARSAGLNACPLMHYSRSGRSADYGSMRHYVEDYLVRRQRPMGPRVQFRYNEN
ncbi:jg4175 [Pararge aegeria aegeria]|uniref:Jg4175 protein n=1 Tax=Pararge aegeria aegeria TaxID=348720 RepID=A0A8S4SE80_9NEOP|nr:jg4175 [Pararge aegeria aegeria]